MTNLILPSHIADERRYAEARREFNATVMATAQRTLEGWRDFEARLRHIDPLLHLIYWDSERPDIPFRKGYWYVVRDNPHGPISWMEININGEPCAPTSRVFDKLAEGRVWASQPMSAHLRREREENARVEADLARSDEERRDHLRDLVNAYTRASISMNDSLPWSQNQSPTAMRDQRARKERKEVVDESRTSPAGTS